MLGLAVGQRPSVKQAKPGTGPYPAGQLAWLLFHIPFPANWGSNPQVASLTFQQGASSVLLNLPANISAEDVRLDSEAWVT